MRRVLPLIVASFAFVFVDAAAKVAVLFARPTARLVEQVRIECGLRRGE